MGTPNILVVVIDGLRASALGAYGNTTYPTPALDRFAAESQLFDWCYATSPDLLEVYQSLWQVGNLSLASQLASKGYSTTLITDDSSISTIPAAANFDRCVQVELDREQSRNRPAARAAAIEQTHLARMFGITADEAASSQGSQPQFLWLHTCGLYGPWDAPLDLQEPLLDEGDPPPLESVEPPDFFATDDPDEVFRYASAYAAQIMVLDDCWEQLWNLLHNSTSSRPWLVTLISSRGFSLGEHGRVGGIDQRLYTEQLHVPWIVYEPTQRNRLVRNNSLVTHSDLLPLLAWEVGLDSSLHGEFRPIPSRESLIAASSEGHRALRTAEWCLRQDASASDETRQALPEFPVFPPQAELFVRPDDRWEANDVAKLLPENVELLSQQLNDSLASMSPH